MTVNQAVIFIKASLFIWKHAKGEKLEEKIGYTIPDSMHVNRQSQITKVLFIAEIEYRRII